MNNRRWLFLKGAIIVFIFILPILPNRAGSQNSYLPEKQYTERVKGIADVDIITLENNVPIKLAGIECPKTERQIVWKGYGLTDEAIDRLHREAREMVKNIFELSKTVRAEIVPRSKDTDGRPYGYIFVKMYRMGENYLKEKELYKATKDAYELFLNAYLVRMGYARVERGAVRNEYEKLLTKMENLARQENLGIWGKVR